MPRIGKDKKTASLSRILILLLTGLCLIAGFSFRIHFASNNPCFMKAPRSYVSIATNAARGLGLVDTQSNFPDPDQTRRPPLVPFVLSRLMIVFGEGEGVAVYQILQALMGALSGLLIALFAWRLANSTIAYLAVLAGYSFWGPSILIGACVMTEITFVFLLCCALPVLLEGFRRGDVAILTIGGLLIGLASLTRPVLYPLYLFLAIAWPWLFRKNPKTTSKKKAAAALAFFGALLLVIGPVIAHNTSVNGRLTLITSSVGLNLYMENAPMERPMVWKWAHEQSQNNGELSGLDEQTRDVVLLKKAYHAIADDPGRFAKNVWSRFISVYGHSKSDFPELPTPLRWNFKLMIFVLIGLIALFYGRFSEALLCVLVLLNFNVVYSLTFFEGRFQETVVPMLLPLAAFGAVMVYRKVRLRITREKSNSESSA